MAEIKVEKRTSPAWLWWLLGLIVVALLIWALAEAFDRDDEIGAVLEVPAVAPVGEAKLEPYPRTTAAGIPVGQIVGNPENWTGRRVSGEVQVTEVVSDRGFWVEEGGERLFVLLDEVPGEIKEINAGQILRMTDAAVYGPGGLSELPGIVDQESARIATDQPVFLAVNSRDVDVLNVGTS